MRFALVLAVCTLSPTLSWAKGKPAKAKKAAPAAPAPAPVAPAAPRATPVATPPAPSRAPAVAAPKNAREVVKQESKIEFDERVVQGQRAAGAIYLFNRGESEFRSMVQVPSSFIDRTIGIVLPETRR